MECDRAALDVEGRVLFSPLPVTDTHARIRLQLHVGARQQNERHNRWHRLVLSYTRSLSRPTRNIEDDNFKNGTR